MCRFDFVLFDDLNNYKHDHDHHSLRFFCSIKTSIKRRRRWWWWQNWMQLTVNSFFWKIHLLLFKFARAARVEIIHFLFRNHTLFFQFWLWFLYEKMRLNNKNDRENIQMWPTAKLLCQFVCQSLLFCLFLLLLKRFNSSKKLMLAWANKPFVFCFKLLTSSSFYFSFFLQCTC